MGYILYILFLICFLSGILEFDHVADKTLLLNYLTTITWNTLARSLTMLLLSGF